MTGTVACFGEVLVRLTPTRSLPVRAADELAVHVGGAEANVAAGLAQLGRPVRMLSALPEGGLGERAMRALRQYGVDCTRIVRREGRMGLYFHEDMHGGRVTYDRAGSAFAGVEIDDWNPDKALSGIAHLHLSGITLALGEGPRRAAAALVQAARARSITVSFDGNFRSQLWATQDCKPGPVIADIVSGSSVFFGNQRDAAVILGSNYEATDPGAPRQAALDLLDAFPDLQAVVSTQRQVGATYCLSARVDRRADACESDAWQVTDLVGRIGTGDAFAAGFLHAWLDDTSDAHALDLGLRCMVAKHALAGDLPDWTASELARMSPGKSDIQR